MRLQLTWVIGLFLTVCVAQGFDRNQALLARQATATFAGESASLATSQTTTSPTTDTRTSGTATPLSSTVPSQIPSNTATALSTSVSASNTASPISASTSASTASANATTQDVLPIQPSITPAIGIAGVIFLASGLILCFIGIKNKFIQIFLSTAFLVALGIEVLIIYVMNPPVSDAVQGGYLVAGVVGGALIGGVALIFKEITEGLGCILGGFTFAMWLLVLAPGGTIKSTSGRIILIAVFCVVCFTLYFSRYTRNYGIIACTSFAGATIFILGVDCFSRAGLKEFWLYIWNLNPDEFPLGTDTYPVTRYIRVEVALIIIIAVVGVMSQVKLWQIVREKRAQKDVERLQDEETRDQLESELGRTIEARNMIDRAHWEGTYGDKNVAQVQVDSAMCSSTDGFSKNSTDGREHDMETIELSDIQDISQRSVARGSNPLVRIRPASAYSKSEERLIRPASSSRFVVDTDKESQQKPDRTSQTWRDRPSSTSGNSRLSATTSKEQVGVEETREPVRAISIQNDLAVSAEEQQPIHERRGTSVQRLSATREAGHDEEEAIHSPFDDDRASSIAATAAEDPDLDALSDGMVSRAPSPYVLNSTRNSMLPVEPEVAVEEDDEEILQKPSQPAKTMSTSTNPAIESPAKGSLSSDEDGQSHAADESNAMGSFSEHLPRQISRAASQYRTTEWAKEVGRAEPEPIEDLFEGTIDGVRVDMKSAADAARADENNASSEPEPRPARHGSEPSQESELRKRIAKEDAQSSAAMPAQDPVSEMQLEKRESVQSASRNPYRQSTGSSRQSSSVAMTPVYVSNNNGSQVSLQRIGSAASQTASARPSSNLMGFRNISAPLIHQTLVESPVESSPPVYPQRQLSSAHSNSNLLDVREHKLQKRITSSSFNNLPHRPSASNLVTTTESQPIPVAPLEGGSSYFPDLTSPEDEEQMTLSQRKTLVKEQVRRQSGSGVTLPRPVSARRSSQPAMPNFPLLTQMALAAQQQQQQPVRMNSSSQQLIYDSHQPQRTSTFDQGKAGQNWSAWQSQKLASASQRSGIATSNGQMDMLLQQRAQKDFENRQRAEQQAAIQMQKDAHMRMGGMHDAHRTALSRMQNKANKHASVQGAV